VPAPGPGLSPEFRKTRGEAERREGERSETRREARRAAAGAINWAPLPNPNSLFPFSRLASLSSLAAARCSAEAG